MADKLTSIKIKQKNGSYTTQIPVSVSAQNVQWDGSHSLLDILGSVDINVGGKGNVQHQFDDLYQNIDAFTDDINSEMTDFTNSTNQSIADFTNTANQNFTDFTNATNQHLSDVLGNISTETKGTVQAQMDKLQNDMNTFHTQMAAEIGTDVSDWLQQNVTPAGSMTTIDSSLTISDAAADAKAVGDALTSLNGSLDALGEDLAGVTDKIQLVTPDNWHNTETDTVGFILNADGTTTENENRFYTDFIPVKTGDVVRHYARTSHNAVYRNAVTCYDKNKTVMASAGKNSNANGGFTVPAGVAYVRITLSVEYQPLIVITINLVPTDWTIQYFEPYQVFTEDFVTEETETLLNELEAMDLSAVTVKGYNLIVDAETGIGSCYASGSSIRFDSTATQYMYAICDVKQNTLYYADRYCRFWILARDNGSVVSSGNVGRLVFNSGEATKLYLTYSSTDWTLGVKVSEATYGVYGGLKKPSFIGGYNSLALSNNYACSLPKRLFRKTVGYPFTIYKDSVFSTPIYKWRLGSGKLTNDDNVDIPTNAEGYGVNGYYYEVYDNSMALIDSLKPRASKTIALSLSDCTAMVIGDSIIERGQITQTMIDEFESAGKTLTLLGTRGTAPNLTEGRSGATAKQYCTSDTAGGQPNLFFNPTTETFDFSYYMSQQGYSGVDFVVVHLGANDLYLASMDDANDKITATLGYIKQIIDSILAYNNSIKILVNLSCTPNTLQSVALTARFVYNNVRIRFAAALQYMLLRYYSESSVRETYGHMILNPSTDIEDHIHPNAAGMAKLGRDIVSQINFWQNE